MNAHVVSELVVVSGKGGTGKTSVVASFAALARNKALADCDVDAADLHLILEPTIERREPFSGGSRAAVVSEECFSCGRCATLCRYGAIDMTGPANDLVQSTYRIDPLRCEGCGVCAHFCPVQAIAFEPAVNGEWYVSETRHGPMVHARLGAAEENSGKLVATVRNEAKRLAETRGLSLSIIDGSPGIGCPVIASISGATLVLIVTEPTPSGLHDMDRVADLAAHFGIPSVVCVNKCDLNPEGTRQIEERCLARSLDVIGWLRYDASVTQAQMRGLSVVEHCSGPAAQDVTNLWDAVSSRLATQQTCI